MNKKSLSPIEDGNLHTLLEKLGASTSRLELIGDTEKPRERDRNKKAPPSVKWQS